jgi:hypothetical protein
MENSDLGYKYLSEEKRFSVLVRKEEKLLLIISILRFLTFFGGAIFVWYIFTNSLSGGFASLLVAIILFFFLLRLYSVHSDMKDFYSNLSLINRNEAAALSGNFSTFGEGAEFIDSNHDFSYDVDLFGKLSVFQYLNRTVTGFGEEILAGWLLDPYSISKDLTERQEAVKELATKEKWRHEFMASGMKTTLNRQSIAGLFSWLEENEVVKSSLLTRIIMYLLPVITILSLILVVAGVLNYLIFTSFFIVNLLIISLRIKTTNRIHNSLSKRYTYLISFNKLLEVFEKESFTSAMLNNVKSGISGRGISAVVAIKKLNRYIQAFDSRINMVVGFFLNGLFMWDLHCIYKLEKWKSDYKDHLPNWLAMIGQVDAFISFGNYAWNNPQFTYPDISDSGRIFSAENLGHQLINPSKRVSNDFAIDRRGTVCIISGANMAGKSTFLRTVAVNYILAMAGAPVCADKMTFIPMKLFTSMRTTDSLSNNESYFYAELKRLKKLKIEIEEEIPVLFILDEILKGTNSSDKSQGSKLFLMKLIGMGATGLIATHDTSLGEMENGFPGIVRNKCFEIEIDGESIKFDYKIQDGITKKMNAAFLMKQMGILQ